ncbi:MAG: addiction module protein [Elusimicrobia bacterium]|nr:addiction module protein [Elusimicrobiota bacterium]
MFHVSYPDLLGLTAAERIQLVEDLWDSLQAFPESIPITMAQKKELDRRMANHKKSPKSFLTWEEVKKGLRAA